LVDDAGIDVVNSSSNNLTFYPLGSNGNVAPSGTLGNPASGLDGPTAIALDSMGNAYVANSFLSGGQLSGSVNVYPSGGYGAAGTPSATITGANTGLYEPTGIAVDAGGNIYVSNSSLTPTTNGSVTLYSSGSNGNVTPIGTIVSSITQSGAFEPTGVALDGGGNIYVPGYAVQGHTLSYSVEVFPSGSNGIVTPSSIIAGAQTQLDDPTGIALDSMANVYIANYANSVTIYPAGS
jgi:hypothetical protein